MSAPFVVSPEARALWERIQARERAAKSAAKDAERPDDDFGMPPIGFGAYVAIGVTLGIGIVLLLVSVVTILGIW